MTIFSTRNAIQAETAIPLDDVLARFPAIASDAPAPDVSNRYQHISTADVLRGLVSEGFGIHSVQIARTRDANNAPFAKHMVRLRRPDLGVKLKAVGDSVPEICLTNAHDGTASYQLFAGILRLVCLNGLVIGSTFAGFRVPHYGRELQGRVIDATYSVVETFEPIASRVQEMQGRILSADQREEFAARALALRYGETAPFSPAALLGVRREDDRGADLWRTYNVIQENIIRGGARAVIVGSNGRPRRTTMRALNRIDASVKINRELWNIAEGMLAA